MKKVFSKYEKLFEQVNLDKSRVYFGLHMRSSICQTIKKILTFSAGAIPFTYMGVPIFQGAPRRIHLQHLADKIVSKYTQWKDNSLSMARRVCLVESVIFNSMVHSMLIYKWSVALLKEMEMVIHNLFGLVIHIIGASSQSWARMCASQSKGDLGIRLLLFMNKAYLFHLALEFLYQSSPHFNFLCMSYLDSFNFPRVSHVSSSIYGQVFTVILLCCFRKLIGLSVSNHMFCFDWMAFLLLRELVFHHTVDNGFLKRILDYYYDGA